MTLRELLHKASFKSTFNSLYKVHYKHLDDETVLKLSIKYSDVFDFLKKINFNGDLKFKIYITEKEEITLDDEKPEKFVDVCIQDTEKDELYSIDFMPWSELIDLEILNCLDLNNYDLLANILWELTFYGWNPDQIKQAGESLSKMTAEDSTPIISLDNFIEELKN